MIKHTWCLLLGITMPVLAWGSVPGIIDDRIVIGWVGAKPAYVNKLEQSDPDKVDIKWDTKRYNNYVCVSKDESDEKGCMSGEFISPKHILTNAHVANGCGIDGKPECIIRTSDGKSLYAKAVFYGNNLEYGQDWAILEITNTNFCNSHYFDYVKPTPIADNMWRAGFGQLRVISNQEFSNIRQAYNAVLSGTKFDFDKDGLPINYGEFNNSFILAFQKKFAELTGEDFVRDYLFDFGTLKLKNNCAIYGKDSLNKKAAHTCHSWPGDSGGSVQNQSDQITLLNSDSDRAIGGNNQNNLGITTENIFSQNVEDALNKAKQDCRETPPPTPSDGRVIGGHV